MENGFQTPEEFSCRRCQSFLVSRDKLAFIHKFTGPQPNEKAYIFNSFSSNITLGPVKTTYCIDRIGTVQGNEVCCSTCQGLLGWKIDTWDEDFQSGAAIGPHDETLRIGQIILKSWKLL